MELDESFGKREPEPGPFSRSLARSADLLKLVEDPGLILSCDADAAVLNRDFDLCADSARMHGDRAAVRCELDGVRQEVEEALAHLALISDDRSQVIGEIGPDLDAVAGRPLSDERECRPDRLGQRERA